MPYTPKVNEFGLFTTRAPAKSDYNGTVDICCPKCSATTTWWVNGWRKTAKSGTKYLSLALKPKGAPERAADGAADNDQDIPF